MNEIITVENTEMQIREYNGQRVVTFKDIDNVHQNKIGTARRNFNRNKKHFIEGEDYIFLSKANSNETKCPIKNISVPNKGITLLTESGYLLIAKSFTDDLSWQVQRTLVNNYFKCKEQAISLPKTIPQNQEKKSLSQWTPEEIVDWKLNDLHKRLKKIERQEEEKPKIGRLQRLVPKKKTWYDRNKSRIWCITRSRDMELKELYHIILEECGRYYDVDGAVDEYRRENGRTMVYPMDLVEEYRELRDIADQVLDYMEQ